MVVVAGDIWWSLKRCMMFVRDDGFGEFYMLEMIDRDLKWRLLKMVIFGHKRHIKITIKAILNTLFYLLYMTFNTKLI